MRVEDHRGPVIFFCCFWQLIVRLTKLVNKQVPDVWQVLEIEDQAEEKIAAGFGNLHNFTVATNVYSQTFPILLPYTVGEHAHQALFQHIYCDGSVCRPRAAIRKT